MDPEGWAQRADRLLRAGNYEGALRVYRCIRAFYDLPVLTQRSSRRHPRGDPFSGGVEAPEPPREEGRSREGANTPDFFADGAHLRAVLSDELRRALDMMDRETRERRAGAGRSP